MEELISRKIIISSTIDENVAREVVEKILSINEFDNHMEETLKEYERQPIEMYINSNGGSAYDGLAIIDAMELSITPIVTIGFGIIASMALGIFVCGDIKYSGRHARYMYHSVSYGIMGNIKDHEDSLKESEVLQRMYDSLFSNTEITKEKMNEIRNKKSDYFFSASEAKKLKIVDEIIPKPNSTLLQIEGE